MNEIILNHIKVYYEVKDVKCSSLRNELENKIITFKQRIKKAKVPSKINYLDKNISDDDQEIDQNENRVLSSKRKRNNDEDKENNRKVILKSEVVKVEERTIVIKKEFDNPEIQQNEFNHNYCDIMYDNEFEGLHLAHFSSYDLESFEELETQIQLVKDPLPIANDKLGLFYILFFTL